MGNLRKKYIGDRSFYKKVLGLAVPMILQNLITNFVNMMDNIMIGQIGTIPMSAVSIVNQYMFVFNITVFGAVSGASIFGTQFFGRRDYEGQRYTVRFRLVMALLLSAAGVLVMSVWDTGLITLFLSKQEPPQVIEETVRLGKQYLRIMLLAMLPHAANQAYSSAARECGEARIPMYGSLAAILINISLNYALIFGHFGMPEFGVSGAAIATVIAKLAEVLIVMIWVHTHREKHPYAAGLYRGFSMPGRLAKQIILKGCPLLVNELMWSVGLSVIAQCYSARGLDVVAARNIAGTITTLFNVIFIQAGAATGIIVGEALGAGKLDEARDLDNKLIAFSLLTTTAAAALLLPAARAFPELYVTEPQVKSLAAFYIALQAAMMPCMAYTNACYFTLRSGGQTAITFLFDSMFTWTVMIPLAFGLTRFTAMDIRLVMTVVTCSEIIKVVIGYFMVRSNLWMNDLVKTS